MKTSAPDKRPLRACPCTGRPEIDAVVSRVTKRFSRSFPILEDDFIQAANLSLFASRETWEHAVDPEVIVGVMTRNACASLLRTWRRERQPTYRHVVLSLEGYTAPVDHQGERVNEITGFMPDPALVAMANDEFRRRDAAIGHAIHAATEWRTPRCSSHLSRPHAVALRSLLLERPNATRQEIIEEFQSRTGRTIHPMNISRHRRDMGLPKVSPGVRRTRDSEAEEVA